MVPEPVVASSARRHGITDQDMLHAFSHPVRYEPPGDEGLVMIIGPDRAANLLEVGVIAGAEGPVIVHAMPARSKYLRKER